MDNVYLAENLGQEVQNMELTELRSEIIRISLNKYINKGKTSEEEKIPSQLWYLILNIEDKTTLIKIRKMIKLDNSQIILSYIDQCSNPPNPKKIN